MPIGGEPQRAGWCGPSSTGCDWAGCLRAAAGGRTAATGRLSDAPISGGPAGIGPRRVELLGGFSHSCHRVSSGHAGCGSRRVFGSTTIRHTEIRCAHLFDRERNLRESGAVLEVQRYPRYFGALQECRTIATSDILTDPLTTELADYLTAPRHSGRSWQCPIWRRREGRLGCCAHELRESRVTGRSTNRTSRASLADLTALALETDRRRQAETRPAQVSRQPGTVLLAVAGWLLLHDARRTDPLGPRRRIRKRYWTMSSSINT